MSGNKIGSTGKKISHVKKLNKTARGSKKKLKQVNLLTPEKEVEIRSVLSKFEHRFEGNTGIEYKWQDIEKFTEKLDINYFVDENVAQDSIIIIIKISNYIRENINKIRKLVKINGLKADGNGHYLLNFTSFINKLSHLVNNNVEIEPLIEDELKLILNIKLTQTYNLLNTRFINKYYYH